MIIYFIIETLEQHWIRKFDEYQIGYLKYYGTLDGFVEEWNFLHPENPILN